MRVFAAGIAAALLLAACARGGGPDAAEEAARRAVDALARGDIAAYRALSAPDAPDGVQPGGIGPGQELLLTSALAGCAGVRADYTVRAVPDMPGARAVTVRFRRPCVDSKVMPDRAELGLEQRRDGTWRVSTLAW
jgi:hypothetical protein